VGRRGTGRWDEKRRGEALGRREKSEEEEPSGACKEKKLRFREV